jgi:excisionase family DNA binding protein
MREGQTTMSIAAASRALKVSRGTVYRLIESGKLQAERRMFMTTKQYLVSRESVERLLTGQPPAD